VSVAARSIIRILLSMILMVVLCDASIAQPNTGIDAIVEEMEELQAIRFEGCVQTTPEALVGVIESRESELSMTRRLALYYYENLKRNPSTPDVVMRTLTAVQNDLKDELRYFEPRTASNDSAALEVYLHQNGFHNGKVYWKFWRDHDAHKNVLTFIVNEGSRAVVDTVIWIGLDSLAPEAQRAVAEVKKFKIGDPYSESAFELSMREIIRALQSTGYYRARYEPPTVAISSDGTHDSILVVFHPGPRARIAQIVFEENMNGYRSVSESTRRRQLEFKEGDWYNLSDIEQSRTLLMQLGVFEIVVIDTLSVVFMDSTGQEMSDSNVSLRVFTKNSKDYDVGASLMLFQTAVDNFLNAGVGTTAQYRNVFNGAQIATITLQYILQDISRLFQGQPLESEALASVSMFWPNIARIAGLRVALQSKVEYSMRILVDPFRLETFTIASRAPVSLYTYTYFNGFDVNLAVERQVPRNFIGAIDSALGDANTAEDTAFVLSTFNQFIVLDNYLSTTGNFFTGINFGLNLRGEHRDNPIDPTTGTFTSIAAEFGWGAGKYVKANFFTVAVMPIASRTTFATKVRAGHIQLLEFERGSSIDTNTYVPLERQFFSGGAASIRSFPSRALHDPNSGVLSTSGGVDSRVLDNVVGSGTLVELGFEFRFKFPRPRGLDDLWASIVERSGFTFFTDIGNAFNRMTVDKYGSMRLKDLWIGSAVASGIGYRFDTPVGPFRIDWATSMYDPLRSDGKFIFNGRENIMGFSNWQLSIGLGHAF